MEIKTSDNQDKSLINCLNEYNDYIDEQLAAIFAVIYNND